MNTNTCKRCDIRKPLADSVFVLCQRCTDAVYPGSDVDKYMELVRRYGR